MNKEDKEKIIKEFNKFVNMNSEELEKWLRTEDSIKSGFKKEGSEETVGHESGRMIVEILKKDKKFYSEDDIKHMRKVISYCKRHLAREKEIASQNAKSNSYKSLKNWGHDAQK